MNEEYSLPQDFLSSQRQDTVRPQYIESDATGMQYQQWLVHTSGNHSLCKVQTCDMSCDAVAIYRPCTRSCDVP